MSFTVSCRAHRQVRTRQARAWKVSRNQEMSLFARSEACLPPPLSGYSARGSSHSHTAPNKYCAALVVATDSLSLAQEARTPPLPPSSLPESFLARSSSQPLRASVLPYLESTAD